MHPESERLAETYIRDFWSANHEMCWLQLEHECSLWLSEDTVLVGKIDATGLTGDGRPFFGDWKTGSKNKARYIEAEKRNWRMTPQALTYGVLMGGAKMNAKPYTGDSEINPLWEGCSRFTVRWALKTVPATTAFEWYEYGDSELIVWRNELLHIAEQIRANRSNLLGSIGNLVDGHWPLNLHNCLRYGERYACPFWAEGCTMLNFEHVPEQMKPRGVGHLAIEAELRKSYNGTNLVVLDASRVSDWMSCNELYRRLWEGSGLTEENENLTIGTDFHELIASHLTLIQKEKNNATVSSSSTA